MRASRRSAWLRRRLPPDAEVRSPWVFLRRARACGHQDGHDDGVLRRREGRAVHCDGLPRRQHCHAGEGGLTDGYTAVQVGYRRVRDRKVTKPELGHLNKGGAIPMRHLQEFRVVLTDGYEPSQLLELHQVFKQGNLIYGVGNSVGKGFQGGVKRWNFARGQMTHGSKSKRQLGSIGAGTMPG